MIVEISVDLSDVVFRQREQVKNDLIAWCSRFSSEQANFLHVEMSQNGQQKQLEFQVDMEKSDIMAEIQGLRNQLYPLNATLYFRFIHGEGETENKP